MKLAICKDFSYFDIDIIDLKDEKSVKEYEHYLAFFTFI